MVPETEVISRALTLRLVLEILSNKVISKLVLFSKQEIVSVRCPFQELITEDHKYWINKDTNLKVQLPIKQLSTITQNFSQSKTNSPEQQWRSKNWRMNWSPRCNINTPQWWVYKVLNDIFLRWVYGWH